MAHYRNTWKPARFFIMDARSALPLLPAMLYISTWTIGIAISVIILFWWLERVGLTFPAAIRASRSWFAGKNRFAQRRQKIRHKVDYGRRPYY